MPYLNQGLGAKAPTTLFSAPTWWEGVRLLPLLLTALVLLAGCVTEEPAAEAIPSAPEGSAAPGDAAVDDGSRPMNASVGAMPHMHDYWEGRERVTLFDDVIDPTQNGDPFQNVEPLFVDKEAKAGRTAWRLPDGKIVYEGTGKMELTATWDDPKVTSLAMEYRSADAQEWAAPVSLPQGKAITLDITPRMTDMPHTKTSRWFFAFETADQPGAALGPFHLKIDIVRVEDITRFPGHPALFEGKSEMVIEDGDHAHAEVSYARRAPQLATEGNFQEKTIAPSRVVPMETKAMRIELDILEATSTPGVVADVSLFYHGADTTFYGHPTILPIEGSFASKRLVYQIPVTMDQTDSPYAETSQWLFFVEPTSKLTGQAQEPTCGGCTDVSIKYHLKAIVYDHELDTYSKLESEG